jgi:peptidoglycan biosynthesis protein MviN/MurJ (putative lipid II flippase)
MALNVFTSWYLAPKFGVIGIALAFVIASILNAAILFVLLRHNLLKEYLKNNSLWTFDNSLSDFLARLLISSVIGGLLGYIFLYVTAPFLNTKTGIGILVQFGVAGLVGLSGFFVSALILKLRNAQKALVFLRKSLGYII